MSNLYETPSIQPILLTATDFTSRDTGDMEGGLDDILPP